jgi:hypothetical protein
LLLALIFGIQNSFAQKTWDGGAGNSNWSSANNWNPNGVPATTDNVTIGNFSVLLDASATVASLSVGSGGTAVLTISGNNPNKTLTVTGNVTINSGATINATGNGGHIFNIAGNLTNNGTLTDSGANMDIIFNGVNQIISGNGSFNFTDFSFSTPGTKSINSNITVTGNWNSNSSAVGGTGIVSLSGNSQTINGSAAGITFPNLSVSGGIKTASAKPLQISGNLSVANSTLINLGSLTNHTTGTLTLGGIGTTNAKFGSTSTSATAPVYKNNTYFSSGTTGYITVSTSSCTAPTITISSIADVCAGVMSFAIPYTATTGSPNLYSISGTGITTVTNGTLNPPSSSIIVGLSPAAAAGTISPSSFTVSSSVTGCVSNNINTSVTVLPGVDTPSFTAGAITVCQDAADETYTATATNSTGITYSVSPIGVGTIGSTDGIMNWNPGFSGTATITASATGCNGPVTADRVVTVNAFPIVTASDVSGCSGSSIALSGSGTPAGGFGNYSVANPYVGTSSTTYTYTYTDLNGCTATSAPANITVTPQPIWYLDADNDQYYTGNGIASCTSPGVGYTETVLGGNDCDDSESDVNPGAVEICYNNIDDNCDGFLSEGCAPVVVNMTASYNNSTLGSLSLAVPAVAYTYAPYENLKYRFSITNVTTNETAPDIIQDSRYVTIPASIHSYNSAYTITVSAVINEEIVPFAGNTITVFSPAVQLITLNSASCGATIASLASTLSSYQGLNATGYTFRIRLNDANPTPVYAYSQSNTRFVGANTFTGLPLQYSTSYKVSVQYSFIDPITNLPTVSGYGAECTVNTPSIPLTNLASPSCGATVNSITANIAAASAPYATGYQFRIRLLSDNGPTPSYYYTTQGSSRFSSLAAFQGITIAYGTAYSISVQYSTFNGISTVWSGYGAECTVNTPSLALPKMVSASESVSASASEFKAIAYPNPFSNNFNLAVEALNPDAETSGNSIVNLKVYDMLGRLIEQKDVRVSDLETTSIGEQYPSGVYNVIMSQDKTIETIRVVKR